MSTLAAIRAELEIAPGLLRRYRTEHTDDGVAGDEHAFLACSFWLADALARTDDVEGSTKVLDILVGLANDVGLLAEQYDPVGRRMAGNMPRPCRTWRSSARCTATTWPSNGGPDDACRAPGSAEARAGEDQVASTDSRTTRRRTLPTCDRGSSSTTTSRRGSA